MKSFRRRERGLNIVIISTSNLVISERTCLRFLHFHFLVVRKRHPTRADQNRKLLLGPLPRVTQLSSTGNDNRNNNHAALSKFAK